MYDQFECVLCGNHTNYLNCDNCHAALSDNDSGPLVDEITIHQDGCHCDSFELDDGSNSR